jgi:L-iditol 2-dehydrogenase
VGERVTFDSTLSCGTCGYCVEGLRNLCDNRMVLGVSCEEFRRDGAFADYVTVPAGAVYPLPADLSFERACMVEPVSIAVHAVDLTPKLLNATAVVVGSGMIGLLVVQALRASGCGRIIALDLEKEKLELASRVGADHAVAAGEGDAAEEVRSLTGGKGADVVFDAVGRAAAVETAVGCVRKGGSLTLIGNLDAVVDLPLQRVVTGQMTLRGSCASAGEYPACLEMIARGVIQVDPLISGVAPLAEGPEWFSRLYRGEKGLMKVILKPSSLTGNGDG